MYENNFIRNRELHQARINEEKKAVDSLDHDTNQAQIVNKKFQNITDGRYQSKLTQLRSAKVDTESNLEETKNSEKKIDVFRDISFKKKWEK